MRTGGTAFGTLLLARALELASANNETSRAPWHSDFREYDVAGSFTQPPNATGQFSIPSFDLTKPWAGNDSFGDDWEIYTAVFAEYPVGENEVNFPSNQWLRIPEDSFEGDDIDDGWSICYWPFSGFNWNRESLEEAQDDPDGDCAGTIPQACIGELLARANSLGGCDSFGGDGINIESCSGVSRGELSDFSTSPVNERDITDEIAQRIPTDNGTAVVLFGDRTVHADADNQTMRDEAYDTAVSDILPYIVSYKYRDGDTTESYSVFKCIRANNVEADSREPESVGWVRSSGSTLGIPMAMLLGFVSIFALSV